MEQHQIFAVRDFLIYIPLLPQNGAVFALLFTPKCAALYVKMSFLSLVRWIDRLTQVFSGQVFSDSGFQTGDLEFDCLIQNFHTYTNEADDPRKETLVV